MKYLLLNNGIITNIIECTEATATHFNAKVFYDGAEIGAVYNPPKPTPSSGPPTYSPSVEELLLEIAADHEARLCEMELGV